MRIFNYIASRYSKTTLSIEIQEFVKSERILTTLFHSNIITTMECGKFHSQKWSESIHVTHQIDGNSMLITNMIIKNWLNFIWEIWTNFLICPNWSDRRTLWIFKNAQRWQSVINRIPHAYRLSYHNPPKKLCKYSKSHFSQKNSFGYRTISNTSKFQRCENF